MYKLLKQILKELQAIRRCLEPKNVTIEIDRKDFKPGINDKGVS